MLYNLTELEKKFLDSNPDQYIKEKQSDGSILYYEPYVKWLESRNNKENNIDALQNLIIEKLTEAISLSTINSNISWIELLNKLLDNVSNLRKNND